MSNKTLNYGAWLFFAVIITALLFNFFTAKNYDASNQSVVRQFEGNDHLLDYIQLKRVAGMENSGKYLFIDLREETFYREDHIPEAINIPFKNLLNRNSLRQIKKHSQSSTLVLYASKEAKAQTACMLLLGKGLGNIRVLSGNFEAAQKYALEDFRPEKAFYRDEKARIDYPRFMQTTPGSAEARDEEKSPDIPEVRTETTTVEGGC